MSNVSANYSQHPLIRTFKGPKNLFGLANVPTIGQILLASEVHEAKKFGRTRQRSNYRVSELTNVSCICTYSNKSGVRQCAEHSGFLPKILGVGEKQWTTVPQNSGLSFQLFCLFFLHFVWGRGQVLENGKSRLNLTLNAIRKQSLNNINTDQFFSHIFSKELQNIT